MLLIPGRFHSDVFCGQSELSRWMDGQLEQIMTATVPAIQLKGSKCRAWLNCLRRFCILHCCFEAKERTLLAPYHVNIHFPSVLEWTSLEAKVSQTLSWPWKGPQSGKGNHGVNNCNRNSFEGRYRTSGTSFLSSHVNCLVPSK